VVLGVRRPDRAANVVKEFELTDDLDDGAEIIDRFQLGWDAGKIDLTAAYQKIDNRGLAEIPGIAMLIKIKKIVI
jgi:hypothetical protein